MYFLVCVSLRASFPLKEGMLLIDLDMMTSLSTHAMLTYHSCLSVLANVGSYKI